MEEFRNLLRSVNRYYEGFEHAVISYINMPGNADKQFSIGSFIRNHPDANSSDILEYMMNETGFWDVYKDYAPSQQIETVV